MPERKNAMPPARVLPRAFAVLAFAAAAFAGLTASDAAAQEPDRATIIYSATPTTAVSIRSRIFGPNRGAPELVFIGTNAGSVTATILGISGTVNADGSNFRPLPESATGTLFVTLDIVQACGVNQGCGGRFGLVGNNATERLANFLALDGASISMYAEAFGRYVVRQGGGADIDVPPGVGFVEIIEGETLLYHLIAAGQEEQLSVVLDAFWTLSPEGVVDIVRQGANEDTLMHRAAININTVAISVLFGIGRGGADIIHDRRLNPNRPGLDGRTPLIYLVSAALAGTEARSSATVALSVMLADRRIREGIQGVAGINFTGDDGKSALDIVAERSETPGANPLAMSLFAQLTTAGAICALNASSQCPASGSVGIPPDTVPNVVFVVRNNHNRAAPGLIARVVAYDTEGSVVGVLSYPGNGKLDLKLKTAVIVIPPNPGEKPPPVN